MLGDLANLATIVGILLVPLGWTFLHYRSLLTAGMEKDAETASTRLHARLTAGERTEIYRGQLSRALDWLGRTIGDVSADGQSRGPFHPFTAQAFGVNLYLSFVYPIVFLFVNWLLVDLPSHFYGLQSVTLVSTAYSRLGVLVAFVVGGYCTYRWIAESGLKPWIFGLIGVVAFSSAGFFISNVFAVTVVYIAIFHVINTNTPGGFHPPLIAILSVSIAVGYAIISVSMTSVIYPMFFSVVIAAALMIPANIALDRFKELTTNGLLHFLFWASCLAFTLVGFRHGWETRGGVFFLFFMALFPLVNVPFDWLSLGLTRYLLQRSLKGEQFRPLFWSALDILGALVLLLLLAVVLVAAVAVANGLAQAGGAPGQLFDIDAFLRDIGARPFDQRFWWVYAMAFSTLLPTFVHFVIAGLGLMTVRPFKPLTDIVASWMEAGFSDHPDHLLTAALILTGQFWLVNLVVVGFFALAGWLLVGLAPGLGDGVLAILRATVLWVGP